jgi:hypothetical protein
MPKAFRRLRHHLRWNWNRRQIQKHFWISRPSCDHQTSGLIHFFSRRNFLRLRQAEAGRCGKLPANRYQKKKPRVGSY